LRRWLVFDAEAVTHADSTGLEALEDIVQALHQDAITMVVARLRGRLQEQFEQAGLFETFGPAHVYPTVRAAVDGCLEEEPHAE
jgi:anti-anti-sigma regulatory factor